MALSFVFGYLAAAYSTGSKLSKPQTIIILIIYIMACSLCLAMAVGYMDSIATLVAAHPSYVPSVL
jgi:hypothetical protein